MHFKEVIGHVHCALSHILSSSSFRTDAYCGMWEMVSMGPFDEVSSHFPDLCNRILAFKTYQNGSSSYSCRSCCKYFPLMRNLVLVEILLHCENLPHEVSPVTPLLVIETVGRRIVFLLFAVLGAPMSLYLPLHRHRVCFLYQFECYRRSWKKPTPSVLFCCPFTHKAVHSSVV